MAHIKEKIKQFVDSIKTIENKNLSIFNFLLTNPNIQNLLYVTDILKQNLLSAEKWIEESKKYNDYFSYVPDYPLLIMSNKNNDIYVGKMNDEKGFYIINKNDYSQGYFVPFGSVNVKKLNGELLDPIQANNYTSQVFLEVNPFLINTAYEQTKNVVGIINKLIDIINKDNECLSVLLKKQENNEDTSNEENFSIKNIEYMLNELRNFKETSSFFQTNLPVNKQVSLSSFVMTQLDKINFNDNTYDKQFRLIENVKDKIYINHQHIPEKINISDIDKYTQDIVDQLNQQLNLQVRVKNIVNHSFKNNLNGYCDHLTNTIGLHLDIHYLNEKMGKNYISKNVMLKILLHEYGHVLYAREVPIIQKLYNMLLRKEFYDKKINKQLNDSLLDKAKIFISQIKNFISNIQNRNMFNKLFNTLNMNMERFADNFASNLLEKHRYIDAISVISKTNQTSIFSELLDLSTFGLYRLHNFYKNLDKNYDFNDIKNLQKFTVNNNQNDISLSHPKYKERIGSKLINVFTNINKNNKKPNQKIFRQII